ncbi:hypothetical protein IW140_006097 [Coemansia sp. RSA 1813]|nr:hypothetical protein EV178_006052 [Coemansia sp. RSA 1646]KAJ1769859.1 hypothetical protein LPJ74_003708 [Coemansia sp. RSA 1843]KAJ2085923.1 hypothetical protein IW138_006020 [Coemansia sp. RSA 986]KAJ2210471.1 hypothetical protein EV179_006216 [Coemansia sp. RSA 487]KAJ2563505.1 hypothetical protein IW140_006097 [Coemansia sp. RSA 1813]
MPKPKGGKLKTALRQAQQSKAKQDARQRSLDDARQARLKKHQKTSAKLAKRRSQFPYTFRDSILLIGEGNFSYAHSIAQTLGTATNIVATAYDSEETVKTKYSEDAETHISGFKALGGVVLYSVDATQMDKSTKGSALAGKKFTHIVFNFPHVGAGIKDQVRNIRVNQSMIVGFFRSARELLSVSTDSISKTPAESTHTATQSNDLSDSDSDDDDDEHARSGRQIKKRRRDTDTTYGSRSIPTEGAFKFEGHQASITYLDSETDTDKEDTEDNNDPDAPDLNRAGQIHVSLKSGLPYSQWNMRHLAKECGFACLTSWPFDLNVFPGYQHRRTLGFKAGVSKDENAEIQSKDPRTHVFVVKQNNAEETADSGGGAHQTDRPAPVSNGRGLKHGKRKVVAGVNSESYDRNMMKKRRR